jgi:chitodextrinase
MRHNDFKFLVTLLGNRSSGVSNNVSDLTPPSVPGTPVLDSKTAVSATIHWTAATDTESAISRYVVWANNTAIKTLSGTSTTIDGLTPSTPYNVQVSAFDVAGNEGPRSGTLTFTTDAGTVADLTSPSVPINLVSSGRTTTGFTVDWDDSTDNVAVADYIVYLNEAQFGTNSASTFTFNSLQEGTLYTVSVVARDTSGNVSAKSVDLDVSTETPQLQAPEAFISDATERTQFGATLNAQVAGHGLPGSWWFEHSADNTFTVSDTTAVQTFNASLDPIGVTQAVTGYTHDETVYYRVVASTAGGTATSAVSSFRCLTLCNTSQTGPTAASLSASSTGTTSVKVSAVVNLNGHDCMATAEVSTSSTFSTVAGTTRKTLTAGCGNASRAFNITGLTASTAYYYRVTVTDDENQSVMTTSTGTVMTDAVIIPAGSPTVDSVSVDPDLNTATFALTVDANSSATTAQVRWRQPDSGGGGGSTSLYLYVDDSGVLRDANNRQYIVRGAVLNNMQTDLTEGHTQNFHLDVDPTTGSNYPNTDAGRRKAVVRKLQDGGIGFVRAVMSWTSLENTIPQNHSGTGFISLPQSNLFHKFSDTNLRLNLQAIEDANNSRGPGVEPIRVLMDLHATGQDKIRGETPSWFMSGGDETSSIRSFFLNNFSLFTGSTPNFGQMPGSLPQYGLSSTWNPLTVWTEALKYLAMLATDYECIVAIDTFNEPNTDWDTTDTGGTRPGLAKMNIVYRNFCRFAADRIWRINPHLIVSPEQSVNSREPPITNPSSYRNSKPVIFDRQEDWIYNATDVSVNGNPNVNDRFNPATLGLGSPNQGGLLFQFHYYPNHDGTISRNEANNQAKNPKRNYTNSLRAGQPMLIGEHSFYAQDADQTDKQYNMNASGADAQTLLFHNWDDDDAAGSKEGFCNWLARTGVLATHWAFLRESWGLVISDNDTTTATPAPGRPGYPARELKDSTNNNFDGQAAQDATVAGTNPPAPGGGPAWVESDVADCGQSPDPQVFSVSATRLASATDYEYQYRADNQYNGGSTTGWQPATPATFTTDSPSSSTDDPDSDTFHPGPYTSWWGKYGGKGKFGPEGFETRAPYAAVVTGDIVMSPRVGLWQVQKGYPVTYIKIRGKYARDDHTVPAGCRDFVTLTGDSTPRPRLKNCDQRGTFYGRNHGITDGTFTNGLAPVPNGGLGAISNTQVDSTAKGEEHNSAESRAYLFNMAVKNVRVANKNYDVTDHLRTASALGIDPFSGQFDVNYCDYDFDQFVQVHAGALRANVVATASEYNRQNFWFKLTPDAMPSNLASTFKIALTWTNYANQSKTATTAAIPFNATPAELANAVGDAMKAADSTHVVRGTTVDSATFPNLDPALRHSGATVCCTGYHNRRSTDAVGWSTGPDQNYAEWQAAWGAKWGVNFTAFDRSLADSTAPDAAPHASATSGVRIDSITITQNNTGVGLTFHTNTQDANSASNYGLGDASRLTRSTGVLKNFHVDNYYGDGMVCNTLYDKSGNNVPTASLGTFEFRYGTFALNPDRILRCANEGNHIDGIQIQGGVDQSPGNREGTATPPVVYAVFFSAQGGSCVFFSGKNRAWVDVGTGTPFFGPGIVSRCLMSGRNKGLYVTGSEQVGAKGCWFNVGEDRFGPGGGVIVPLMVNPSYKGSLTNSTARQDHVDDLVWPNAAAPALIQNYWSSNKSQRVRADFPTVLQNGAMDVTRLIGTGDRGYNSTSLLLP